LGTSNKISSFKMVILHPAIQGGCTTVCIHTYTHIHACTCAGFRYKLLSWRWSRKVKLKMYVFYSNKGYCSADWNDMVYFTRGVNDGALTKVCNLLKYIISMPICHTHVLHKYC